MNVTLDIPGFLTVLLHLWYTSPRALCFSVCWLESDAFAIHSLFHAVFHLVCLMWDRSCFLFFFKLFGFYTEHSGNGYFVFVVSPWKSGQHIGITSLLSAGPSVLLKQVTLVPLNAPVFVYGFFFTRYFCALTSFFHSVFIAWTHGCKLL